MFNLLLTSLIYKTLVSDSVIETFNLSFQTIDRDKLFSLLRIDDPHVINISHAVRTIMVINRRSSSFNFRIDSKDSGRNIVDSIALVFKDRINIEEPTLKLLKKMVLHKLTIENSEREDPFKLWIIDDFSLMKNTPVTLLTLDIYATINEYKIFGIRLWKNKIVHIKGDYYSDLPK